MRLSLPGGKNRGVNILTACLANFSEKFSICRVFGFKKLPPIWNQDGTVNV